MVNEFLPSIVAGLVAAGVNVALLPMIFKGKLRHEREYQKLESSMKERVDDLKATHSDAKEEWEEAIERLETSKNKLQDELKEQYRLNAEQDREMRQTISWLKDLSGIAAKDRRESRST